MGEVVEGGVGIASRTSPRSTIERVQIELRKEYNVREERKRELEFLENGGNPLDFKLRNVASVSVQSTSFTGQHPDLFATSEAKVSFDFAASPCGDSAESSDRPGPHNCEPNTADNLMLFDAEQEFSEGQRTSLPPGRTLVSFQPSFQIDERHKTIEPEDSSAFVLPRKEYKRRYRSRRNRDGIRSGPNDVNLTSGSHSVSLPYRHTLRDVKSLHMLSNFNSDLESLKGDIHEKPVLLDGLQDIELDGEKTLESTKDLVKGISVDALSDNLASEHLLDNQNNKQLLSDSAITPALMDSDQPGTFHPMEEMTSAISDSSPRATFMKESSSCRKNGFSYSEGDASHNAHKNAPHTMLGLEADLSCSQNSPRSDVKNGEKITKMKNINSNGKLNDKKLLSDGASIMESDKILKENKKIVYELRTSPFDNEPATDCQNQENNGFALQPAKELNQRGSAFGTGAIIQFNRNEVEAGCASGSEPCGMSAAILADNDPENENSCNIEHQNGVDISIPSISGVSLSRVPSVSFEAQISSGPESKLGNGNDEDSILKEALIIETKRKRIKELSLMTSPVKLHSRSQWDYVLEEMSWLANDFAQERMWKVIAASQMCYQASFRSQLRKQENKSDMEAKKVACSLAKAIIGFWHSIKESCKETEQLSRKGRSPAIVAYAESFLKHNNSYVPFSQEAVVPLTPDRTSDLGILDMSWDDSLTDENLFYTIPPGALETYRQSIEVCEAQCEKFRSSMQEVVDTSEFDAVAGIMYDEDEYDMGEYEMPMVFEGHKSLKFRQKKRKQLTHVFGADTCEVGSSLVGMQYSNKVTTQKSILLLKRPGSSLNVSIPTKRVRTASRRVISPFSAGTSGCMVGQNKADVSSGDTSSFQDDQSTLHGGSLVPNAMESEFGEDFEKQLQFDTSEVSTKLKKKPKHQNASYKQRCQVDSSYPNEQRGHWERRSDVYQLESNGSDGLLGPPMIKKLKMRQSHENSFDYNIAPIGGSVSSPVTSQMSNMSNPNKIIKAICGRDHGRSRKPNVLKQLPACQTGSGSPWSLFEDQALVVLVHDLGPNWELISDAVNDTLHFKHIFRKPKDCNERHHVLMDGTSGDGADSAEDSGSSQLYPSTLPGIPKGSARQLFQRLQEPLDEDTLKSHFDKIIMLMQKQHNRKTQDPKQLQQPHSSHTVALSQSCPNNLNGALVLTPLDFYEATLAGPDMLSLGYEGPTSSLLAYPNQGNAAPMLPAYGVSTSIQVSSTLMLSNNFTSSPGSFTSGARDGRYGAPRLIDDHQRMQQYGQMVSGRNISQHNMTASGVLTGNDRCVRVVPGGNGMGMVGGITRSMPTARPGLQGIASSSMLNSGTVASPVMVSANAHTGIGSGSAMLRPRETAIIMRPGMSQDSQRQMIVPDLQMQVSPANSQGMPIFGGLSSAFPNHTASPPVSSYPLHHQQSHPISPRQPQGLNPHHPHFQGPASHLHNPQQQAYAIRLAKERQLKQRLLQQQPQQRQFAVSDSLAPHVQSQSQLPTASPMRNSSEMKSQSISLPVSSSALTRVSSMNSLQQNQEKHHTPIQIIERDAQAGGNGLNNQTGRQRQRQQQHFSQANRQHPQQRQHSQSQQQTKILKGPGGGNMAILQTVAIVPSLLNEVSTTPENQCLEKGEPATPLMQSQCLYPGPTQKVYLGQSLSSKNLHQMTSHSDVSSHGHVSPVAHTGFSAAQQSVPSLTVPGANLPQAASNRKLVNQIHSAINKAVHPTGPTNSDPPNKSQTREFDTGLQQKSISSELSTTAAMDSNALNSESNLGLLPSTITCSIEQVPQAGQGLGQRHTLASLPAIKHGANVHWQQQTSHLQHSQQPHPHQQPRPPQQQQQQQQLPLLPLHSQQQTKLLQAGNGNLYGRPSDAGI